MNMPILKAKMALHNDKGADLAKALGITETTLSTKINGKTDFTRNEIFKIKKRYNLSANEIDNIFFNLKVT